MHESLSERLSRFTPTGTGLDRDALLFEAGQASARPSRRWIALAGLLAASQVVCVVLVVSLVLLWPRPTPPVPVIAVSRPVPEVGAPAGSLANADAAAQAALNRQVLESPEHDLPPPRPVAALVPSDPPVHAFAPPRGELD